MIDVMLLLGFVLLSVFFSWQGWHRFLLGREVSPIRPEMGAIFLLLTLLLAWKGYCMGRCPLRGGEDILLFLSWTISLFYFLLGRAYRISVLGLFTMPIISVLLLGGFLVRVMGHAAPESHHGFFLTAHVGLILMSYGASALCAVAGMAFLLQNSFLKRRSLMNGSLVLPPIRLLELVMKRLLLSAFVLLFCGMGLGLVCGLGISVVKQIFVGILLSLYVILGFFTFFRGLPGRLLALAVIVLFFFSLIIIYVSK